MSDIRPLVDLFYLHKLSEEDIFTFNSLSIMSENICKAAYRCLDINGVIILEEKQVKLLGVTIDNNNIIAPLFFS